MNIRKKESDMIQVRFGRQKIEVDEGLGISHVDGISYM